MEVTYEQQRQARSRARRIVNDLRCQMPVLNDYSYEQVWQAVLDAKSKDRTFVGLIFLDHIMNGSVPPECPYSLMED